MMSAEYPEIIPEPFNYPCTSYNGNAEDFCLNDVVENCHAPYAGIGSYSDPPCPPLFTSESSRHILIQGLAARQDRCLLDSPSDREAQGRSSYSCEQSVVILMKEPVEPVGKLTKEVVAAEDDMIVNINHVSVSPAPRCDGGTDLEKVAKNLLSVEGNSPLPPQLCVNDAPALGSADRLTTPVVEYPEVEKITGCDLRGFEIAKLEDASSSEQDTSQVQPKKCGKPIGEIEGKQDSNPSNEGVSTNLLAHTNRRRTGSTLLQHLPVAHRNLHIPMVETRKLSDSALCMRRDKLRRTVHDQAKQRCLSDTQAPSTSFSLDEDERESSAHGCDSGFHDDKGSRFHDNIVSSPRVSLQSLDLLSQDDGSETHSRGRRVTPFIPYSLLSQDGSQSDDMSSIYQSSCSGNPGTMVHPRERSRRSLMKHYSQGSISGLSISGASVGGASSIGASSDSPSLSSILDCQSNATGVTDLLSSLGFDDFDSPQLVPDRFIPKELDHLKPTSMKLALVECNSSPDPPRSPDSLTSGQYSTSTNHKEVIQATQTLPAVTEPSDLPLGATAENFLDYKPRPGSPVPVSTVEDTNPVEEEPSDKTKKAAQTPLFTDTMHYVDLSRSRVLETVPEETASDLSPSPRWFSPRVSIDHSVHLDLAEGKLGASLNVQKARKRSLPTNREGYRWSIGSLVESDTGDSIHLSVTSYDDMIAAEREKERDNLPQVACDDTLVGGVTRRRRKGVYNPPQTLLSWLSTQKTIDEEEDTDPDELPWPFNEQARLRKSLTEISLAQKYALGESFEKEEHYGRHTSNSMTSSQKDLLSPSPISTPSRLSPQNTLSDDEDEAHPANNLQKHRQSHKEDRLRISSPFAQPKNHPLTSTSGQSSLDLQDSSNQEVDESCLSTVSLLQTERGSLATLPSDFCLTETPQLPVRGPSPLNPSSNYHQVDEDSCHSSSVGSISVLTTPISTQEPVSFIIGEIVKQSSFEKPEPKELIRKMSDDMHLVQKDGILDDLPASHISAISSVQTSCASRRLRFAERRQKSLETPPQEVIPSSNKSSTNRVRRKPVYGDAPSSPQDPFFTVSKEQKEVEKYMVL